MKKIQFAAMVLATLLSGCAEIGLIGGTPPGRGAGAGQVRSAAAASVSITAGEARRLAVANGLTGRRSLPPGIARNLARGKALPPGIARQVVPGGMLGSLPRVEGHEWRMAGTDLILVALGTLIVVEILSEVFE